MLRLEAHLSRQVQRVLWRISGAFYIAFATRMSRMICVGCARDAAPAACDMHTRGTRTSDAFVARVSSIHELIL
jgi:hypothetical protein